MNSLQSITTKKYIELDSTYRNRIDYPLQARFKLNIGHSGNGLNNARDPITEGTSEWVWNGMGTFNNTLVGTSEALQYNPAVNAIKPRRGYFVRDVPTNQTSLIESSFSPGVPSNGTIILETPFGDAWVNNSNATFFVNEDSTHVYFPFPEEKQDNAFKGWYLTQIETNDFNSSVITNYNQQFSMMTLDSALPSFVNTGTFQLSKGPIVMAGFNPPAGTWTGNQVQLSTNASTDDDAYNGMIIKFISRQNVSGSPPSQGVIFPTYYTFITDYDGATQTATLKDPVPNYTSTVRAYSISKFKKDISSFMNVSNSCENKRRLYRITCDDLILPNVPLKSGGRPVYYPFVYVVLYNNSSSTNSLINSNNPNSQNVVFRCPIEDTDNPTVATFLKLKSEQVQTFKLNIYEDILFEVYLPDGTLFQTINSDTISPIPPNPNLQISASFSLE